jgi:hypothetical protein
MEGGDPLQSVCDRIKTRLQENSEASSSLLCPLFPEYLGCTVHIENDAIVLRSRNCQQLARNQQASVCESCAQQRATTASALRKKTQLKTQPDGSFHPNTNIRYIARDRVRSALEMKPNREDIKRMKRLLAKEVKRRLKTRGQETSTAKDTELVYQIFGEANKTIDEVLNSDEDAPALALWEVHYEQFKKIKANGGKKTTAVRFDPTITRFIPLVAEYLIAKSIPSTTTGSNLLF